MGFGSLMFMYTMLHTHNSYVVFYINVGGKTSLGDFQVSNITILNVERSGLIQPTPRRLSRGQLVFSRNHSGEAECHCVWRASNLQKISCGLFRMVLGQLIPDWGTWFLQSTPSERTRGVTNQNNHCKSFWVRNCLPHQDFLEQQEEQTLKLG